ncbi:serine hydrolase [Janibacter sp. Soil728]|uniref:serine hydrolase domain-containing protein n=1 Tax=Janibacter sp. Soil728 TaxID=1736393 RepID=UPI0006F74956|nr:serine hydrolase domain-containing protein [Janibacter sp. Soil728]KRE35082.1 serine hydrolase [Janibacter sp. Soil728]
MSFSDETGRALTIRALTAQTDGRVPGLAAGVARAGALEWSTGIGTIDLASPGDAPDDDTQYAVASNSKTFTAVAVMALRDEGRLDLDDTVETHLSDSSHARVTIRQLLSHTSGMQREPIGDVFDTMVMPTREELLAGWSRAERVGRPHDRWHYSNLGFSLLGEIISRLDDCPWEESIRRRILDPLEMTRTGTAPTGRRAKGYYVPPFADVPLEEPVFEARAMDPAGGLRSTLTDMARWGGFIASPVEEILSPDTLEEMCQPQVVSDTIGWTSAWGLGLQLVRHEGRTWVGHTGGWPGSITGVFTERSSATTGLIFMNNSAPVAPGAAAIDLGTIAIEREPVVPEPWQPGTTVPEDLVPLLGHWYSEGSHFVLSVREGKLEARVAGQPKEQPPSVLEAEGADRYRTVSGRESGELLRVQRDESGGVSHFNWATYRFTREPLAFGAWL